jgi:cytochrome c556
MRRLFRRAGGIPALVLLIPLGAIGVSAQSGGTRVDSPPAAEAIIDTPEFMTWMMKPAYVELQQALARRLADRGDWASAYQKAARLAETSNLLFIRHHAGADTSEWAARSAAVRQAAADVANGLLFGLRNVRAEDYDAVKKKFADVAAACNACHRRFGGTNAPSIRD